MKKIIVPTDFSENAANAYSYALELAIATNSQVKVVHVFHPSTYNESQVIPTLDQMMSTRRRKLDLFTRQSELYDGTVSTLVEQDVILGLAVDELVRLSKEDSTDFILMGTTGSSGVMEKLLGTISSTVSQKAKCPVWLVPPNAKFKGVKNIAYAGNYESANTAMVEEILNISKIFDSNVHLVHVNNSKSKNSDWKFEELILENLFEQRVPDFKFQMGTIHNESIWEGLYNYAEEEKIDMIAMVARRRSFWEKLRHKSRTKQMILHTKVPILIMHVDDK